MNVLHVQCSACRVAPTCPRNGSSPHLLQGGTKVFCRIVGGYGREPVDRSILSEESAARSDRDGPCMTFAEVPTVDPDSGHLVMQLTKVFHQPVRHERETTNLMQDMLYPKSHS